MRVRLPLLALALAGCLIPPGPSERAADAARSLNLAARFGRMDMAIELTAVPTRPAFLEHRAAWGKELRVLDVELSSFKMPSGERADVEVEYSWSRVNEQQLRVTRVAQEWRDAGGGFRLVRERRVAGDVGLFGEPVPATPSAPARDVQFATKVIR